MAPHNDNKGILLVEDDPAFRKLYRQVLVDAGWEVAEADDRPKARAIAKDRLFPVVLLDLMLPPDGTVEKGLMQLSEIIAAQPNTKVVVVSGAGDVTHMLKAVKSGAHDFLTKPVDPDVLLVVVERALARFGLEQQIDNLRTSLSQQAPESGMIGRSPSFLKALQLAEAVAATDLPVLISGESGTGKELMARTVHQRSQRSFQRFVAVNCGALTESLLESTLFGHKKGSFTGATSDRRGLFAEADKGTVFLDEIGDMPSSLQVKLLRTLESGEILPVGADRPSIVDVRIVCATNRELLSMVHEGQFREDLFWRIRGAEVALPPLRERPSDLPVLAQVFLGQCASLSGNGKAKQISEAAAGALLSHDWPGNLRELRFEMQRATVVAGDCPEISAGHLSFVAENVGPSKGPTTLQERVEALERRELEAALAKFHGNRTKTAEALGLSRQGLLNKLGRYGL